MRPGRARGCPNPRGPLLQTAAVRSNSQPDRRVSWVGRAGKEREKGIGKENVKKEAFSSRENKNKS